MTAQIDGVTIKLGGQEYVVPPLCLGDARRLLPQVQEVQKRIQTGEPPDDKTFATVVDVVGSALRRNYPDIKDEDLEKVLDLGNFKSVMNAAMGVSGFVRKPLGESERGSPSTGTPSTPT